MNQSDTDYSTSKVKLLRHRDDNKATSHSLNTKDYFPHSSFHTQPEAQNKPVTIIIINFQL